MLPTMTVPWFLRLKTTFGDHREVGRRPLCCDAVSIDSWRVSRTRYEGRNRVPCNASVRPRIVKLSGMLCCRNHCVTVNYFFARTSKKSLTTSPSNAADRTLIVPRQNISDQNVIFLSDSVG